MHMPIVLCVAVLLSLVAAPAPAATFIVDTVADTIDTSPGDGFCGTPVGPCSLRAAVQETNALAGADTITLPAGTYVLTLTGPPEDAGASGDLDVHDALTITGAGAATTIIDAGGIARVLEAGVTSFSSPLTLTISGVTIRGGNAQSNDGCNGIVDVGDGDGLCVNTMGLAMSDAVVEQNAGQGIFNLGGMALTRVVVRNNSGIGAYVVIGNASVVESTIAGNSTGLAFNPDYDVLIRNSTVSGNGTRGVVVSVGCEPPQVPCPTINPIVLENVTITGHTSRAIDNVIQAFPSGATAPIPVTVRNSVLAGNGSECNGEIVSGGYNLLQTLTGCTMSGDTTGNVVGQGAVLGPLADNGGPTPTHALLPGSPAINAANPAAPGSGGNACLATDQRGVARPVGPRCDMGAFESTCGDGNLDAGEICETGVCCQACVPNDAACGPCGLVCDGGTTCVDPNSCQEAASTKSTITLADDADPTKDGARWKWAGTTPATKSDYGSPTTTTGYTLCVLDGAGGTFVLLDAPAGCDADACWEERSNAFTLASGPAAQGKFTARLKTGMPGKLQARTKGTAFALPPLPLALPARVRLIRTDTGACWDARFAAHVIKNTAERVRAKSD